MRTVMQRKSWRPARAPAIEWARIDPLVYGVEGRRRQARATAEALGAGWCGIRRWLRRTVGTGAKAASGAAGQREDRTPTRRAHGTSPGLARFLRERVLAPISRRRQRLRAIAHLSDLDDRLLADIDLRRIDIELAVDGARGDPHTRPAGRRAAWVASDHLLGEGHGKGDAANADRRLQDLAA